MFSSYTLFVSFVTILCIGMLFIPFLNVISMYGFIGLASFGMGGYETVGNVLTLQLWAVKAETVFQFLHFWYWLGCAFTPLLMEPFLNEALELNETTSINETFNKSTPIFRDVHFVEGTGLPFVGIPYFIIAGLGIAVIMFMLVFIPSSFGGGGASQQKDTTSSEGRRFRFLMLSLLFVFFFLNIGIEVVVLTFLYSFGLSDVPGMRMSKASSAHHNSIFLFSIVVGQFFAILISRRFSPTAIICIDMVGIAASVVLLLLLPVYASTAPILFWVGIGTLGFFFASCYGTGFVWAERYITVNARAASVFVIGASLGEMVLPIPIGFLIEDSPMIFLYFIAAYFGALALVFFVLLKLASTKGRRANRPESKKEEIMSLEDAKEGIPLK